MSDGDPTVEPRTLVGDDDAAAFVARAIERHGGLERWRRMRLTLAPLSLSGLLPWMKGAGRTFVLPGHAEIEPARGRAVFHDFPRAGATGVFASGLVALGDAAPAAHRQTFRWLGKWRRWSPLDALYFFGYALTHYHAVPFTLPAAELRAWDPRRRAHGGVPTRRAHPLRRAALPVRRDRPHLAPRLRRRRRRRVGAWRALLA
jgi:hypothetical protein